MTPFTVISTLLLWSSLDLLWSSGYDLLRSPRSSFFRSVRSAVPRRWSVASLRSTAHGGENLYDTWAPQQSAPSPIDPVPLEPSPLPSFGPSREIFTFLGELVVSKTTQSTLDDTLTSEITAVFKNRFDAVTEEEGWRVVADTIIANNNLCDNLKELTDSFTASMISAGFTSSDIATIIYSAPKIVSLPGLAIESSSSFFLEEIGLRRYDFRKFIREGVRENGGRTARLLTQEGLRDAEGIEVCLSSCGLGPTLIRRIFFNFVDINPQLCLKFVVFLNWEAVGMQTQGIGSVFRKGGDVVMKWLQNGEGERGGEARRWEKIFQVVEGLRDFFGTGKEGVKVHKIIAIFPGVLMVDLPEIISVCRVLTETCGMTIFESARTVENFPILLGERADVLQERATWMKSDDGAQVPGKDLAKMVRSFPILMVTEAEKMERVVRFLKEIGVGNIGRFITRIPPILTYDVEDDLREKWNFLRDYNDGDDEFSVYELVRFPAFFSYPFERVIKVRFDYIEHLENIADLAKERKLHYPLDKILTGTENNFVNNCGLPGGKEAFQEWQQFLMIGGNNNFESEAAE